MNTMIGAVGDNNVTEAFPQPPLAHVIAPVISCNFKFPAVLLPPLVNSNQAPRGVYSTPVRFMAPPPGPRINLGDIFVTLHVPQGVCAVTEPSFTFTVSAELRRSC